MYFLQINTNKLKLLSENLASSLLAWHVFASCAVANGIFPVSFAAQALALSIFPQPQKEFLHITKRFCTVYVNIEINTRTCNS